MVKRAVIGVYRTSHPFGIHEVRPMDLVKSRYIALYPFRVNFFVS